MFQVLPVIKFFVMVMGNTLNSHDTFVEQLKVPSNLQEVSSLNDSNVIVAFVPIVSRAGTDIEAALQRIPATKPLVLVVLHHTFEKYYVAPDSRFCVNRSGVFVVDCLYYEDQGLLRCLRNDEAVKAVKQHLSDMLPERPNMKRNKILISTVTLIIIILIVIWFVVGKQ